MYFSTRPKPILQFLRTRRIAIPNHIEPRFLLDEAEFYGIAQMTERLRLCSKLGNQSCGGIHFYEMLRLKNQSEVTTITGNGPIVAVGAEYSISIFAFDEHHGWNTMASHLLEQKIEQLSVKYLSPKRMGDPLCHLAASMSSVILFFKVLIIFISVDCQYYFQVTEQVRTLPEDDRYRLEELDGYNFDKNEEYSQLKIEYLTFVGSQLLAVSDCDCRVAVWNAARQGRWQEHKVPEKVSCLETVSTFVYMGSCSGKIHFTDLQKFPLRTKDNSLLVTELHQDYLKEPITALSVSYEKSPQIEKCDPFESLELCYGRTGLHDGIEIRISGTANGTVRVLVSTCVSPEHHTHGLRSLQLLQTYKGIDDI